MQKIKMYLNKVQIIGFILSTIILILIPITKNYKLVSVGWFFIGLTSFGNALFTKEWSIIGRTWNEKDDKNPDKQLTKKYSDKVSFMLISNANRIAGINNFYKDVKLVDNCFEVLFCKISKKKDILKNLYYLTKYDITKLPGFKFYKINNLKIEFNTPPEKGWSIDGEELVTDKNIFEIKMVRNVKILLPKKNVEKLFLEEME